MFGEKSEPSLDSKEERQMLRPFSEMKDLLNKRIKEYYSSDRLNLEPIIVQWKSRFHPHDWGEVLLGARFLVIHNDLYNPPFYSCHITLLEFLKRKHSIGGIHVKDGFGLYLYNDGPVYETKPLQPLADSIVEYVQITESSEFKELNEGLVRQILTEVPNRFASALEEMLEKREEAAKSESKP